MGLSVIATSGTSSVEDKVQIGSSLLVMFQQYTIQMVTYVNYVFFGFVNEQKLKRDTD